MKHIIVTILLMVLLTYVVESSNIDRVLLRDVQSLVLSAGAYTTGRRSSPVPQLSCEGAHCAHGPSSVLCRNAGSDGRDVVWRCEADLPTGLRFGALDVSCEGYAHPDDAYVLAGSCGLTYHLVGSPIPPPPPVARVYVPPPPAPVFVRAAPPPPVHHQHHDDGMGVALSIIAVIVGVGVFGMLICCIIGTSTPDHGGRSVPPSSPSYAESRASASPPVIIRDRPAPPVVVVRDDNGADFASGVMLGAALHPRPTGFADGRASTATRTVYVDSTPAPTVSSNPPVVPPASTTTAVGFATTSRREDSDDGDGWPAASSTSYAKTRRGSDDEGKASKKSSKSSFSFSSGKSTGFASTSRR